MNYGCQYKPETIPDINNIYKFKESKDYRTRQYQDVKDIKSGYIEYFPKRDKFKMSLPNPILLMTAR